MRLQRLARSLSRLETQDIKTQPQFNHYVTDKQAHGSCLEKSEIISFSNRKQTGLEKERTNKQTIIDKIQHSWKPIN